MKEKKRNFTSEPKHFSFGAFMVTISGAPKFFSLKGETLCFPINTVIFGNSLFFHGLSRCFSFADLHPESLKKFGKRLGTKEKLKKILATFIEILQQIPSVW